MKNKIFEPADILIPRNTDMTKWSVIACDQFTSEPQYWREVKKIVGNEPSTFCITLPEVYLEREDIEKRVSRINQTMEDYLKSGFFQEMNNRFVYVERTLRDGSIRRGLVGAIDLEAYDYHKGSQSPVRATEGTVLSRIPPRVRVRKNAALELPHVMLLIDDENKTVIEPLEKEKGLT